MLLLLKWIMDGGPVLFHQVRLGRGGEPFLLHKIRTTPRAYQPASWDWPDDDYPPRTLFGRSLRRVDLDELPQLWNVLKGQMSLVGPRPETPFHSRIFLRRYPLYSCRWQVRPGLTGLAQVRGWRGNTGMEPRLASDLEYIFHRNLRMYVTVLLRTVFNAFRRGLG
jgi:lipopolysaccharide/colanic/teichoic acid biosynthesis glycosyltransferase